MILPGPRIDHLRPLHLLLDAVADQEVVNSPTGIVNLAGPDSLRPPGIDILHISLHVAERVDESLGQKMRSAS